MSYFCIYRLILQCALLATSVSSVHAKPLLTNSEDTYESVCLAYGDTPLRLVEICGRALETTGASDAERLSMMDSLAWAHEAMGNVAEARRIFEAMYALDPHSALALNGLGWLSFMSDSYPEAAQWFEKAMNVRSEAQSLAGFSSSRYHAGDMSAAEALEFLDAALAISPDYDWAMRQRAWILIDEGRLEEASAAFEMALDLDPDDAQASYGMAYILVEQEDWRRALPYVNRALQVDPDYVGALSYRSLILLNLGRAAQALKDGQRVVDLYPDTSDGYVRVARAQAALGRSADALATLETAQERAGYDSYLSYWQAELLWNNDRVDDALAEIEQVFSRGDADYYAHELKAQILLNASRTEEARMAVDTALEAHPGAPWLIFYDSIVLIGEGKYALAEVRFDVAVKQGLPREELPVFLRQLTGAARYVQAVKMRVRYRDQADAEPDG